MNKCLSYLMVFSLFLLFSIQLLAQSDFEGKVKFKVTHDDDVSFLDYYMKGDNVRIEVGENEQGVFLKTADRSLILMPEEKMYMDLNNSVFSKLPNMAGIQLIVSYLSPTPVCIRTVPGNVPRKCRGTMTNSVSSSGSGSPGGGANDPRRQVVILDLWRME